MDLPRVKTRGDHDTNRCAVGLVKETGSKEARGWDGRPQTPPAVHAPLQKHTKKGGGRRSTNPTMDEIRDVSRDSTRFAHSRGEGPKNPKYIEGVKIGGHCRDHGGKTLVRDTDSDRVTEES